MNYIRTYYKLTKPGIIYGNSLAVIAGFLLASQGTIRWNIFLGVFVGIAFVIACACVLNNIIDRDIDKKMTRTKQRALVKGEVSPIQAIIYAAILGLIGFTLLIAEVNLLTAVLGFVALLLYVVVYGFAKRKTAFGTLVGALPGAIPPVAGYTAVTGRLDELALLLFIVLLTWQMPHFYAIAIYRAKEYKAAKLPVWPLVKGIASTKKQILLFVSLFVVASLSLTVLGYTGLSYALIMSFLGSLWLTRALKGFTTQKDDTWAKGMFGFSLLVLLGWCGMLAVDVWLP